MANSFVPSVKLSSLTATALINQTREFFGDLPDTRKKATSNHLKYTLSDAALSAFSVFFTQSPSFLDYQKRMQKKHGKNNAQSIFDVHQIPSANQIRNLLDPISPKTLFPLLRAITVGIYQRDHLLPFRSVGNTLLIALDGTDFFSSAKISCPNCTCQVLKNGQTL